LVVFICRRLILTFFDLFLFVCGLCFWVTLANPLSKKAKIMSTLITGGTGFIGSCLAEDLIGEGERPVLYDVAPVRGTLREMEADVDFVQGSLSNLSELLNCLDQYSVDRIFHLGGLLSLPSETNPWASFEANVKGTYNMLEAGRIKRVKQFIYASTIATYSKGITSDVVYDHTIQRPTTMYGVTKVFGELLGRFYSRKFDLDFRGVRLPSVVGPGAKTAHMSIYNAWAIEEPLRGRPYELRCEPETKCPVIYFKDVVRALKLLAQAERSHISTMIYNLAGISPPFSARELVDTVRTRIPEARLTFNPDQKVMELLREIGRLKIDDSCAQSEWGWHVAYSLEEMVDDFIGEFKKKSSYYLE
jgi:threonine 3-dehydrogenase